MWDGPGGKTEEGKKVRGRGWKTAADDAATRRTTSNFFVKRLPSFSPLCIRARFLRAFVVFSPRKHRV